MKIRVEVARFTIEMRRCMIVLEFGQRNSLSAVPTAIAIRNNTIEPVNTMVPVSLENLP